MGKVPFPCPGPIFIVTGGVQAQYRRSPVGGAPLNLAPAVISLPAKNVRTPNETVNNNVAPPTSSNPNKGGCLSHTLGAAHLFGQSNWLRSPSDKASSHSWTSQWQWKESFTTVQDWLLRSLTQARICLFLAKHSFRRQVVRRTGISRRGLLCKAPEGTGRLRKVLVGALWIPKRALTPLSW
jgi:hypothetical protein